MRTLAISLMLLWWGCGPAEGSAEGETDLGDEPAPEVSTGDEAVAPDPDEGAAAAAASGDWTSVCRRYAEQCESGVCTLDACLERCSQETALQDGNRELCPVIYCAVQTERCDGDEPGDPAITACIREQGWE